MLKISLLSKKFTNFTGKNSRILRIKNAKFSGYHFYMNTNILGDFQICINEPLKQIHLFFTHFIEYLILVLDDNMNKESE